MGDDAAGRARRLEAWLDARCLEGSAAAPPEQALAALPSGAQALGVAGVPESWRAALAWCGVPLARGPLRWERDLVAAAVERPLARSGRLLLPEPARLAELSSVALKPLRLYIAERLGCRLQMAPGVRLWLWPSCAVLLSLQPAPLLGFLYGPRPGHREGLELPPWGLQIVAW